MMSEHAATLLEYTNVEVGTTGDEGDLIVVDMVDVYGQAVQFPLVAMHFALILLDCKVSVSPGTTVAPFSNVIVTSDVVDHEHVA